jgi:hypothetical protein
MSNVAFFVALLLLLLLRVACCVLFSDHCAAARTATQVPLHRTAAATAIAIASPKSSSFFCAVHFAIFCLAFYTKRRWFKRFAESARRWNQLAAVCRDTTAGTKFSTTYALPHQQYPPQTSQCRKYFQVQGPAETERGN